MAKPSTAVTKAKPVALPAAIKAQLAAQVADIHKRISAPSGDRITVTQSKTFKLPNGQEVDELEAVIVDFAAANFYYETGYERNNITPPKCFALGLEPAGLVPSDNSPDKQCAACAGCWANQFKSSGNGKACQNTRLLAILPTDADVDTDIQILKVSPTALRSFDGHVSKVVSKHNVPIFGVVTRIFFSPDTEYASLRFEDQGIATEALITLAFNRQAEAQKRLLTEPDVSTAANDAPAPKSVNKRVPVKKAAGR